MSEQPKRIAEDQAQIAAILARYPPVPPGHRRVSDWWGWEDVPVEDDHEKTIESEIQVPSLRATRPHVVLWLEALWRRAEAMLRTTTHRRGPDRRVKP